MPPPPSSWPRVEALEALAVLQEAANVVDTAAAALPEIASVVPDKTPVSAMGALAQGSTGPFGRGIATLSAGTGVGAFLEGSASGALVGPGSVYGPLTTWQ